MRRCRVIDAQLRVLLGVSILWSVASDHGSELRDYENIQPPTSYMSDTRHAKASALLEFTVWIWSNMIDWSEDYSLEWTRKSKELKDIVLDWPTCTQDKERVPSTHTEASHSLMSLSYCIVSTTGLMLLNVIGMLQGKFLWMQHHLVQAYKWPDWTWQTNITCSRLLQAYPDPFIYQNTYAIKYNWEKGIHWDISSLKLIACSKL